MDVEAAPAPGDRDAPESTPDLSTPELNTPELNTPELTPPQGAGAPTPEPDALAVTYPVESPDEYPDTAADDDRLWREVPPHH
jgi:hypothetical protein